MAARLLSRSKILARTFSSPLTSHHFLPISHGRIAPPLTGGPDLASPVAPLGSIKVQMLDPIYSSQENSLHMRRKILPSSKMTFPFSMSGNKFTFRGIATTSHSEEPSSQDTSADSPNPVMPQRIKFKRPDKTARNIMNILNKEALEEAQVNREFPDIKPGYIIQLKVEVPENKRRHSVLKGIVIAISNAGVHSTFRLRRLVAGVGVESVFPLYSPNIKEMKVLDKKQVRRAKLYYLRARMNPLKNK